MWRRLACLREKHGGGVRARTTDLQSDALTTTLLRPHMSTHEYCRNRRKRENHEIDCNSI